VRLEYPEPKSESEFWGILRTLAESHFYFERVEPANESGFPDLHFCTRREVFPDEHLEGTIELKYFKPNERPNLATAKFRGNQKAALMDYEGAGGGRRFVLAYHNGQVFAWNTENAVLALKGRPHSLRAFLVDKLDEETKNRFIRWLTEILT
jgi:hypothetical protein